MKMGMKSASMKQLVHLGQLIKNGKFKQFDYSNPWDNWMHYKGPVPELDLQNIDGNIPIVLLTAEHDSLSVKGDVDRLAEELGDRVRLYKQYSDFDHASFSVGKDMSWTNDVL